MPISTHQRLIHALDVSTVEEAKERVETLADAVHFYKLGLQLFMDRHAFSLIDWLRQRNKEVFIDLKFYDVPNTVASAVQGLSDYDVQFATVHGNRAILEAATKHKKKLKILAVTVLSSLDQKDMSDMGVDCDIQQLACHRARYAQQLGCDGVICSGNDIALIRQTMDPDKSLGQLIVAPGIRNQTTHAVSGDDQKRVVTVSQALKNGADYIVVGRPIAQSDNPKRQALEIQQQIKDCFGGQH